MSSRKPKATDSKASKTTRDLSLGADEAAQVRGGGRVNVEYKPQKADGSLDAGVHFKYDIKANKEG